MWNIFDIAFIVGFVGIFMHAWKREVYMIIYCFIKAIHQIWISVRSVYFVFEINLKIVVLSINSKS